MFRWTVMIVLLLAVVGAAILGSASAAPRHINIELLNQKDQWAHLSAYNGRIWVVHNWLTTAPRLTSSKGGFDFFGLRINSSIQFPMRVTLLSCPFWFPSVVFAFVVGGPVLVAWRRSVRRQFLGLCTKCGYDLTGLTEPRCPECGAPVVSRRLGRSARIVSSRRLYPVAIFLLVVLVGWSQRTKLASMATSLFSKDPAHSGPVLYSSGGFPGLLPKTAFVELPGPPAPGETDAGGWILAQDGDGFLPIPLPPDSISRVRPPWPGP